MREYYLGDKIQRSETRSTANFGIVFASFAHLYWGRQKSISFLKKKPKKAQHLLGLHKSGAVLRDSRPIKANK